MVGFYIGSCKPKFEDVGLDLIDELIEYHPSSCSQGIAIEIDRLVADAPALQDLRGTAGPTGYSSLPKCTIVGQNFQREENGQWTGVHFGDLRCQGLPRLDSEWISYYESNDHVKTLSPLTKIPGMKMVTNSMTEPMHTMDGGVLRDFACRLNKVIQSTKEGHSPTVRARFHEYTSMLAKFFAPTEIQRRLTTLNEYEKWKARQTRNYFMYLALPSLHQFSAVFGKEVRFYEAQIQQLVVALRLVGGFSSQPVPPNDLDRAETIFQNFAQKMVNKCGYLWATHKNHNVVHVTSDCRNKQCHLDRNSAYAAENFHQIEKRLIQRGGHTHVQIL